MSDPSADRHLLLQRLEQFRLLCNNVPVAMAYFEAGPQGDLCRYANQGYAAMFGRDEQSVLGLSVEQVIGQEAGDAIQPYIERVRRERCKVAYERQLTDASGGTFWLEVNLLPHLSGQRDDGIVGAFVLINDISRHRRAEAALREGEERLAKFMHASAEGIVFHKGGYITDVNPPLLALLGYTLPEMLGRKTLEFVPPAQRARVAEVIASGHEISYDSAVLHRDGRSMPVEFIVRSVYHQGEHLRMTIVRDLRDRAEAQARIHHLAHHDALTGLPNRLAFMERAEAMLTQAQAAGEQLALLFIDLDHFKRVNDSLGHPAGDMLLQTVAARITSTLREDDLVARFGGDEFVLLLAGDPTRAAVQEVADKLVEAVGAPLEMEGASISVTPSIGVALAPEHGASSAELIKHADTAMYRAKSHGRAMWHFFEPAMEAAARAELAMEGRLAQAILEQEFVLHFQPLLASQGEALVGVEALLRWAHPQLGLVEPDAFIPLAEARRLILPIGDWVLREALRCAVRWHALGLLNAPMAVNLSALQFQSPALVDWVQRALRDTGARGSMLELELTERMLVDDLDAVSARLKQLRALGVQIAVDDFGTGYTSLAHLRHLPLDRLKIDRSFVLDLPGDAGSAAIAGAIIQMGHGLGLRVVAEGVETAAQREWVRQHGCDASQGFLHARPMPAPEFERWARVRLGQAAAPAG